MSGLTDAQVARAFEIADAVRSRPQEYREMREALATVDGMTTDEMLDHLDMLWGSDELRFGASDEEIANELRRQIRKDFGFEVLS